MSADATSIISMALGDMPWHVPTTMSTTHRGFVADTGGLQGVVGVGYQDMWGDFSKFADTMLSRDCISTHLITDYD